MFWMRRHRRHIHRLLSGVLLAAGLVQWFLWSNYLVIAPGIAEDLSTMITVQGTSKTSEGAFLMTAVSTWRGNLLSLIAAALSPEVEFAPAFRHIPPGMDMERYGRIMSQLMDESHMIAKVVALRKVGYEVAVNPRVEIEEVLPGSPALGKLAPGDVLAAVDGRPIASTGDVTEYISSRPIGVEVLVSVVRDGKKLAVRVPTTRSPENPSKAALRILIIPRNTYELPVDIDIETGEIGGSSAGMMMCLEVIDQLLEEDLTRGYTVAGTGTLNLDGKVGEISGVAQKVFAAEEAGADLFLCPIENERDARAAARRIEVKAVGSMDEALEFLRGLEPAKSRISMERGE